MNPKLATLVTRLDSYAGPVPLMDLDRHLRSSGLTTRDLQEFVRFDPDYYRRNPIVTRGHYQLLLLCWDRGQGSPAHNHRGSNCAFMVIEGQATETICQPLPDRKAVPLHSRFLWPRELSLSHDADVHTVVNRRPERLITLHAYSPPLTMMETYTLAEEPLISASP